MFLDSTDNKLAFTRLGCSCKIPETKLFNLLKESGLENVIKSERVTPINAETSFIHTLDFFTPIIDDPLLQGKITAVNVLNDIFTMGVPDVLGFSVILALKKETSFEAAKQILKGINFVCKQVGTEIIGGHTIEHCDILIGGSAIGIESANKIITTQGAESGDILLLTKPLGAQMVMRSLFLKNRGLLKKLPAKFSESYKSAIKILTHPAHNVAKVMHSSKVNAATDITGFGFYSHAKQIAKNSGVNFQIHYLPMIQGSKELAKMLSLDYQRGKLPETAGGILMSIPKKSLNNVVRSLKKLNETPFVIGEVLEPLEKSGEIYFADDVKIDEV